MDKHRCRGRQGQGHQHEAEQGNGDDVDKGRDQRNLIEEQRRHRHQTEAHAPLDACDTGNRTQRVALFPTQMLAAGELPEQRHGNERQPERGAERRRRIPRKHQQYRSREPTRHAHRTPADQRQLCHREHDQCSLRGHRESRQRRVQPRREKTRPRRQFQVARGRCNRQAQRSPAAEYEYQPRHQAHVQPRDRHEVAGTGVAQRLPMALFESESLADGQCSQECSRVRRWRRRPDHIRKAGANGQPPAFDTVDPCSGRLPLPNVSRRAVAFLKEPALVVESPGIAEPPGPLEPHDQVEGAPRLHRLRRRIVPA